MGHLRNTAETIASERAVDAQTFRDLAETVEGMNQKDLRKLKESIGDSDAMLRQDFSAGISLTLQLSRLKNIAAVLSADHVSNDILSREHHEAILSASRHHSYASGFKRLQDEVIAKWEKRNSNKRGLVLLKSEVEEYFDDNIRCLGVESEKWGDDLPLWYPPRDPCYMLVGDAKTWILNCVTDPNLTPSTADGKAGMEDVDWKPDGTETGRFKEFDVVRGHSVLN